VSETDVCSVNKNPLPKRRVKISIVTLSFNQRPYLGEAINSVLSQGYDELEYIIVDPGSTDGSRELIESYRSRIAHTIFEPDRGAADGLNKGFARATGDVFGFLNADDILFPGALHHVAGFFDAHPEYEMAMGNGYVIDGNGRKLRHVVARNFSVRRYLYGGTSWMQQSTFFRRGTFLRSSKFNLQNRTCWDGELFVTMASLGARIGYVKADLSGFRLHVTSISGSGNNAEAYKRDCRRIFMQTTGRHWRMIDELLRFLYRTEGFVTRMGSILASRGSE
jgi:glycosyltransferase involved in cell wall biosynthesis